MAGCNLFLKSTGKSEKDYISETSIVYLVQNANSHYWYVAGGANLVYPEEGYLETFFVDDIEYRYFGSDLDSMEKLYLYLGEVYTKKAIDEFVKISNIIEHKGHLAQPNADHGDLRQWELIKLKQITDKEGEKYCIFELPYPDSEMEPDLVTVTIVRDSQKGWLVSNIPGRF